MMEMDYGADKYQPPRSVHKSKSKEFIDKAEYINTIVSVEPIILKLQTTNLDF